MRTLVLLILCIALNALPAAALAPAQAGDSFAETVPADVGLFVEVHGADDLLSSLTDPQVWTTLAELAGQPAQPEEVSEWRRRIKQTIAMEPEQAIRTLFARGVAFIGSGPGRSQDAVLLCRPAADVAPKELLARWQAKPIPFANRASVYQLPNNIGVGVFGGLLAFGDVSPNGQMLPRILRFAETDPPQRLSGAPEYKRLLARVPENPDAILFARLAAAAPAGSSRSARSAGRPGATTQPAASTLLELPGPLRDSSNVLLAMHRQRNLLHFSAVGDNSQRLAAGARATRGDPSRVPMMIETLPERTLLAWGAQVDYPAIAAAVQDLPERNVLRMAFQMHEKSGTVERFLAALDPSACVAIGMVNPPTRKLPGPPVPAVALLLATHDSEQTEFEFNSLLQSSVSLYNLLALSWGLPQLPQSSDENIARRAAHVVDFSGLLSRFDGGALGELQLCWAMHNDVLVIATHADWLRQILEARQGLAPDLSRTLRLTHKPIAPHSETVAVAQCGPIADLAGLWLNFLQEHAPQTLTEEWWRSRQPGGGNVRLGVNIENNAEQRALRVVTVDASSPADGVIRAGDVIVGCGDNRRFTTTQPVREIREAIAERRNGRWIELLIERDGETTTKRVPLPFVDPIQVLRRATAFGRIAQRVIYHDDERDDAGPRGFMTVELRTSAAPLFQMGTTTRPEPVSRDGR